MIKVLIGTSDFRRGIEIAIIDERGGKTFAAEPVELKFIEIADNIFIPATLTFGYHMSQQFLQAMAEVLDGQGVKTDKDAKIEGTLGATRYHLEDLRKLLKLKV